MKSRDLLWAAIGVSAGALVYGALVESNRLVVRQVRLNLPQWPRRMDGYRIAVLGDFHVRDEYSYRLAQRAVEAAVDADAEMVAIVGDFVGHWSGKLIPMLGNVLEPLLALQGRCVAIPGNHDYLLGTPEILSEIMDELNIKLLRNETWVHAGVCWVGVDSANADQDDAEAAMAQADRSLPCVALWHEPDVVDGLPSGCALCLSGHSHGGQFLTPWGAPFVGSRNGRRYRRGFYPDASTPIFVTSGVGTTGPPSRLFCPPEVVILELYASPDPQN